MSELAPCFACGASEKTPAFDGNYTSFDGSPGYGSRFDNTGSLRIHLCDDCLETHKDRVTLVTRVQVQVRPEEVTQSWVCPICKDVAYEGRCEQERTIFWLGDLDNPEQDNFLISLPSKETAVEYLRRYEKHAQELGLCDFVFRIAPDLRKDPEASKWMVTVRA